MQMIDMATHALICHNKLSGRLNVFFLKPRLREKNHEQC